MVRAGRVRHPAGWIEGGYREIQNPPRRYALIDLKELSVLCGFAKVDEFQQEHRRWVEEALMREAHRRDERWSESVAVGSEAFVEEIKRELGIAVRHREVDGADGMWVLREARGAYRGDFGGKIGALRQENTVPWAENQVSVYG